MNENSFVQSTEEIASLSSIFSPEVKQRVTLTALLISSWGQFGLNVARLEEGQRRQPLPGREQEGPTAVTQLWPDCIQGSKGPVARHDTAGTLTSVCNVAATANEETHSNVNNNSVRGEEN